MYLYSACPSNLTAAQRRFTDFDRKHVYRSREKALIIAIVNSGVKITVNEKDVSLEGDGRN